MIERREFARVMDAVGLQIVALADYNPTSAVAGLGDSRRVRVSNKYDIPGYGDVRRDHPAVSDYIDALEERIRELSLDRATTPERPTHRVSLSASGMAFADQRMFEPGDQLHLLITLFPDLHRVETEAVVVNVGVEAELASGDLHTYRLAYMNMDPDSVQLINGHVMNLRRIMRKSAA